MFHVSRMDLGDIVTLTPRIPRSASKDECRKTPRVCFSPTVEQCIIGLVGFGVSKSVTILAAFMELANASWCPTVYYTDDDLIKPAVTSDFHITDEHWALYPVVTERVGYIDCMAMVRDKRIDVVDKPNCVSLVEQEFIHHISDEDRTVLLQELDRQQEKEYV